MRGLLLVGVGLVAVAWAVLGGPAGADESSPFGCHPPAVPEALALSRDAGVGWVRAHDYWEAFYWYQAEPEPGHWVWKDEQVRLVRSYGMEVLGMLGKPPNWASTIPVKKRGWETIYYPPKSLTQWRDYVAAVVGHYQGQVRYWEVWNEPNIDAFWRPRPQPERYARLLKAAYEAAKRANPECVVLAPCTAGIDVGFIEKVLENGGGKYFDVLSLHSYRSLPDIGLEEEIYQVREVMWRYGVNKPIWNTEVGWDAASPGVTEEDKANYLVRLFLEGFRLGIEKTFWYNFQGGKYGLMLDREGYEPAPAYWAYRTVTNTLGGAEYAGRLQVAEPARAYVFRKKGAPVLGLWSAGEPLEVRVPVYAEKVEVVEPNGAGTSVATPGGVLVWKATGKPVFVTGSGSEVFGQLRPEVAPSSVVVAAGGTGVFWCGSGVLSEGAFEWPVYREKGEGALVGSVKARVNLVPGAGRVGPQARCSFMVPREMAAGVYELRCSLVGGKDLVVGLVVSPPVRWEVEAAPETHSCYASPLPADFGRDGTPEMVAATGDGEVLAISGLGATRRLYRSAKPITSTPAVGDLDRDGTPETVAAGQDRRLACVDGQGVVRWQAELAGEVEWGGPAIADINADGALEVVVGDLSGEVSAFRGDGALLWRVAAGTPVNGPLGVADVNAAPGLEVIVPCENGTVQAFSAAGAALWAFVTKSSCSSGPIGGRLSASADPVVLFGSDDGRLYCVDGAGVEQWRFEAGQPIDSSLAAADLDGDGALEIVFADSRQWLFCVGCDGRERWRYSIGGADSNPAIADMDGDGGLEVLAGSSTGMLYCLSADGRLEWAYRRTQKVASSPAVVDLLGDGRFEVICSYRDGAVVCLEGGRGGAVPWPMWRGGPGGGGEIGPNWPLSR